jgi:hypothetical protein
MEHYGADATLMLVSRKTTVTVGRDARLGKTGPGPTPNAKVASDDPDLEFARKCQHVADLLAWHGLPNARDVAAAWVVAFFDEMDPTFCVLEWIEAGWRDPVLVNAVLRICRTRALSEACMALLNKDLGRGYHHRMIRRVAGAMRLVRRNAA